MVIKKLRVLGGQKQDMVVMEVGPLVTCYSRSTCSSLWQRIVCKLLVIIAFSIVVQCAWLYNVC